MRLAMTDVETAPTHDVPVKGCSDGNALLLDSSEVLGDEVPVHEGIHEVGGVGSTAVNLARRGRGTTKQGKIGVRKGPQQSWLVAGQKEIAKEGQSERLMFAT